MWVINFTSCSVDQSTTENIYKSKILNSLHNLCDNYAKVVSQCIAFSRFHFLNFVSEFLPKHKTRNINLWINFSSEWWFAVLDFISEIQPITFQWNWLMHRSIATGKCVQETTLNSAFCNQNILMHICIRRLEIRFCIRMASDAVSAEAYLAMRRWALDNAINVIFVFVFFCSIVVVRHV